MGYTHTMHLDAIVVPNTPVEEVAKAFLPIAEYFGYDGVEIFTEGARVLGDDEFFYNPDTGELHASTYGEVGYSYYDLVCDLARNLGRIVSEPGEIHLYDHDTGDIDEAKTVIEFGPSEKAINAYIAKRDIEAGLKMMEPHLSADALDAVKHIVFKEA